MNMRHVVALGLSGWYLKGPPTTPGGYVNTQAPLARWLQGSSFDSADECDQFLAAFQLAAKKSPPRDPKDLARINGMRCIATDDPRLIVDPDGFLK
jgi:hypothetical protein